MTSAPDERRGAVDDGATTSARKGARPAGGPLGVGGVALALLRRPILSMVGLLLVALAALLGRLLGPSGESLVNLVSYVPFLGGGWAIYAASVPSAEGSPRGQLPSPARALAYGATALVVVVLSGIADVTLTVIGGMLVRTALALGPTAALAESAWPHRALWRGVLVIDERPREFLKVAALSLGVALVFGLLFQALMTEAFGQAAGTRLADGAARGLGSVLVSAIWMRFYLVVRGTSAPASTEP